MFSIIRLKFEFANMTRTRGAEYLQEKRVSLLESTGHSATLFVQAEERFQVVVQAPKGQRVTATCTCQFFKGGNKCKHIWASYLYLEENRIFEVKPEADVPAVSTSTSSEPQNWMKSFSSFLNSEEKHQADLHHFIDDQNDSKVDKLRSGVYTINAQKTKLNDKVFLNLLCQEMKKDGTLSVIKSAGESEDTIPLHGNPVDQEILSTLLGPTKEGDTGYYSRSKTNSVTIQPRSVNQILAQISDAGRLYIDFTKYSYSNTYENVLPYSFLKNEFAFVFELTAEAPPEFHNGPLGEADSQGVEASKYFLKAFLFDRLTEQRVPTTDIQLFISDLVFCEKYCFQSSYGKYANWMKVFKGDSELMIPRAQIRQFLEIFYKQPDHPELILPKNLGIEKMAVEPKLKVYFEQMGESFYEVKLHYSYNNHKIENNKGNASFYDGAQNQIIQRDLTSELKMRQQVLQLLYSESAAKKMNLSGKMILGIDALKEVLPELLKLEHEIYIQSAKVKKISSMDFKLTNHVDWFDLEILKDKKSDLTAADLPTLLQSINDDSGFVKIKDQVFLLPEEISKKLRMIAKFAGSTEFDENGKLKISKVQSLFLSSILEQESESQVQVNKDIFTSLMNAKSKISKVNLIPKDFIGELRPYQKLGVGWLNKLLEHGLGGLLADDMGLGKTVQVIAFLTKARQADQLTKARQTDQLTKARQTAQPKAPDSNRQVLIVCPKSLIFNWNDEFVKFSPKTRVLCYQGKNRQTLLEDISKYDVIITTYHSLRQDIQLLRQHQFKYFIVDEAQNIKNSDSQVSMACRLVKASHVFALTGTPVENSIQDFFSIMNVVLTGIF